MRMSPLRMLLIVSLFQIYLIGCETMSDIHGRSNNLQLNKNNALYTNINNSQLNSCHIQARLSQFIPAFQWPWAKKSTKSINKRVTPKPNYIEDIRALESLHKLIHEGPTPIILEVYSPNCKACEVLTPILERAVNSLNGSIKLAKLEGSAHPDFCRQMGITAFPTIITLCDQKVIDLFVGVPKSEQFKTLLLNMLQRNSTFPGLATVGLEYIDWNVVNRHTSRSDPSNTHLYYLNQKFHDILGSGGPSHLTKDRLERRIDSLFSTLKNETNSEVVIIMGSTLIDYLKNILNTLRLKDQFFYKLIQAYPQTLDKYTSLSAKNPYLFKRVTSYPQGVQLLQLVGFQSYPNNSETKRYIWEGNNKLYLEQAIITISDWLERISIEI